MTWEELKEEAKKMGYDVSDGNTIHTYTIYLDVYIYDYGTVSLKDGWGAEVYIEHRTPEQMLAIMKALQ